MEEIKPKEQIEELVKAAEDLAKAMEKSDLYLRSGKIIESSNNWMIAVSAGLYYGLLRILTNFT